LLPVPVAADSYNNDDEFARVAVDDAVVAVKAADVAVADDSNSYSAGVGVGFV
jgi:hypothetical protein